MKGFPKTLGEARTEKYGNYPYREGYCAHPVQCSSGVLQCSRRNGYGPGALYCRQHAKILAQSFVPNWDREDYQEAEKALRSSKPSLGEKVIAFLFENGWLIDGVTPIEQVRIPTTKSPLYGKVGSELATYTYGGRLRLTLPNTSWKVTVGPRTVCFYQRIGKHTDFKGNFPTRDLDEIATFVKLIKDNKS